jgi:N-methyl-L-tryptophan oxidase
VAGSRSCLYESTPDRDFIVDWVPGSSRVLVAGGGSGHGFKFGGAIGPLIADALEDKDNPLGAPFKLGDRFAAAGRSRPSR